jgi:hypothetical protein
MSWLPRRRAAFWAVLSISAKIGDQDVTLNYKGKIAGGEIKFTSEMARSRTPGPHDG